MTEENKQIKIIFQNKDLIAIDKAPGMVVFPDENYTEGTLSDRLLERFPELKRVNERAGILHRLDKDTSGLILAAKNKKTFDFIKKAFEEKRIEKKYLALIIGNLREKRGEIATLIGRSPADRKKQKAFLSHEPEAERKGLRRAITEYEVLKNLTDGKNLYALLEVSPKTGRKHQIRVHLAHIGHPIAGDKTYGFKGQAVPEGLNRHFLHASYLKFQLPDGQKKEFQSPLPEDLKQSLSQLVEIENLQKY